MIAIIIFVLSMGMYLATIAPTLSFFDSGEMIAGAYTLGVAHPPGYPIYVTLGKLFTFIPLGNVAFRVNLMSSFFASMTSVMIYYITKAMLDEPMEAGKKRPLITIAQAAGIFSALAFAFSYNLWAWAVVSKFYTLNAFVVSCILMILIRWRRARKEEGAKGGHSLAYLYTIAFLFGIATVVHISQFVLIPVYLLYILIVDGSVFIEVHDIRGKKGKWNPVELVKRVNLKTILIMGFFFMLGHSIYMHVPVRAAQSPLINWGAAVTWPDFKWVYNREGYPTVGGERSWSLFWMQLKSFNLVREFTWAGVPLILGGLWGHFRKDWRHALILLFGSVFLTSAIVVGGNPIPENIFLLEQFYIPVYIFLTVAMGGAVYLFLKKYTVGIITAGVAIPFFFLGEVPTKYLQGLFTGAGGAAGQKALFGLFYPTPLYFLFFVVFSGIITASVIWLSREKSLSSRYLVGMVAALLIILYPAYQVKAHYWKNDRSNNFIAYDMGNAELAFAPQFSVLFTWGDSGAFPMWYLQDVEEKRPDVLLIHTPHLPLTWFLNSLRRDADSVGNPEAIAGNYKYLRNYNGIKGIEQLLSIPEDFRDPADMIKQIIQFNRDRTIAFDYSSRYSVNMPYDVEPYGLTYRAPAKDLAEENLRTWRYLVLRGLPDPTICLDLDEGKAVSIYGYIHQDLGKKYWDMGLSPLGRQEYAQAVRYAPELWDSVGQFIQ